MLINLLDIRLHCKTVNNDTCVDKFIECMAIIRIIYSWSILYSLLICWGSTSRNGVKQTRRKYSVLSWDALHISLLLCQCIRFVEIAVIIRYFMRLKGRWWGFQRDWSAEQFALEIRWQLSFGDATASLTFQHKFHRTAVSICEYDIPLNFIHSI